MSTNTIRLVGWRAGMRTVELAKLIRTSMRTPNLAQAKAKVDELLDGRPTVVELADDVNPAAFRQQCEVLGAVLSHED